MKLRYPPGPVRAEFFGGLNKIEMAQIIFEIVQANNEQFVAQKCPRQVTELFNIGVNERVPVRK